jgi:REP element-mobilizing transposase RayT
MSSARGIERRDIFYSDIDRRDFLDRLAQLVPALDIAISAWCLLTNHVHLLVRSGVAQHLLGGPFPATRPRSVGF